MTRLIETVAYVLSVAVLAGIAIAILERATA